MSQKNSITSHHVDVAPASLRVNMVKLQGKVSKLVRALTVPN